MATLFTMSGTGAPPGYLYTLNYMGLATGNTHVPVFYTNLISQANVNAGATTLNTQLLATSGHKIAFGHSLGALVCLRWLNQYGPTSTIPFADLEFVLIGNPARKYGGMIYADVGNLATYAGQIQTLAGVYTMPASPAYTVHDFTRQYDGWSDWPDEMEPIAVANASIGMVTTHIDYTTPRLGAFGNKSLVEGNVTYEWVRTYPSPLHSYTLTLMNDDVYRPIIEKAYDRPVNIEGWGTGLPPTLADLDSISEQVEYYRKYKSQL